ncbi:DUF4160 domain-containing protein [Rudanella lutea]|uniref:DUF4160 domain-containing protein n=1 Tax=Rudanella lutea TaxID=451374 RepID=UPI000370B2CC|nr:DUF4160 domain-containing protein [Rudanella lutea]
MPEIFRVFGFRFLFYSNDHLPVHIHVRNGDGEARFAIKPVRLLESKGMKSKDLKVAEGLVEENEDIIEQRWKEFFNQ